MASTLRTSVASRNAANDARLALANGGAIKLYTGAQPASPETAVTTQTLLGTVAVQTPAFGANSSGSAALAGVPLTAVAVATGVAAWFRIVKSDGVTGVIDGNVDVAANTPDMVLAALNIQSGATIQIDSYAFAQP